MPQYVEFNKGITPTLEGVKRECWRNNKLFWTSIPKNANMVFRGICQRYGAPRQKVNLDIQPYPNVVFCIWRDPETRLISGLGECAKRQRRGRFTAELATQMLEELSVSADKFDEHLEPQVMYATGFPIRYTHVLRFEHLLDDMQTVDIFKNNTNPWRQYIHPDRITKTHHAIGTSIEEILNQNKALVEHIIKKYYSEDLDIFNDHSKIM